MRLATVFDQTHNTHAAIEIDGSWHPLPHRDVSELLRDAEWRGSMDAAAHRDPIIGAVPTLLLPSPTKVICCGHNYADHIAEMGHEPPLYPTLFAKFADSLCGPTDDIVTDGLSEKVDWEAELAVVVGATISRVDVESARSAIAGYTVANDVSLRDWQRRTPQWLQGKAFDRTTPVGPVLVTRDELDPAAGLRITCAVNDELVQDGNTRTLVFGAAELVSYVSQFTTLRPGDIILTGTPGGVGAARNPPRFLADGDVLTTTIEGIGTLVNRLSTMPHSQEIADE
jgi:acylpyruvate hydrolase